MDPDRPRSVPEHIHMDTVSSSNDVLLRMAEQGALEHTLVVATQQTHARGGSGHWVAPPGGLWFSTLWTPGIDACSAALITLAAGWGVREGVRRYTGVGAGLKWPNDLVLEDKKVGGVLVEGRVIGHDVEQAVIGVGLNVNNPPHGLPEEIRDQATSLQAQTDQDHDLDNLLDAVVQGLLEARDLLDDPDELVRSFKSCWTQKGRDVQVDTGHTLVEGLALDIDPEGALLVETDHGTHRLDDPSLAKFVRIV